MTLPPPSISYLSETFQELVRELIEAEEGTAATKDVPQSSAHVLADAMGQLIEVLKRVEADRARNARAQVSPGGTGPEVDLDELGDYGLTLLRELAARASALGLRTSRLELEGLSFPFALWLARAGGEIRTLEPVANALAALANRLRDPEELEELCLGMNEIVDAVAPLIRQDLEKTDPYRPWRVLLLNRGIVATRSHRIPLMESAFRSIVQELPEEAGPFFREAMEQMELLNYPSAVRRLVERYFRNWSSSGTLH